MLSLKNNVAVLTGAGRKDGVGAALARLLAKEGCHVLVNCLTPKKETKEILAECRSFGVEAELFIGDLTDKKICQALANFAAQKWNRVDILVNCIGFSKSAAEGNPLNHHAADFTELLNINVVAPYMMCQVLEDLLRSAENPAVVNVSSNAGLTGKGSSLAYAVAKGAENTLTLGLAQALSPEIRVNAVCPAFIDSSWWDDKPFANEKLDRNSNTYEAFKQSIKENNLLQKTLKPVSVAYTILTILKNPMLTGELIRIDAGAHIGKAAKK